jgi:hypothetical protein
MFKKNKSRKVKKETSDPTTQDSHAFTKAGDQSPTSLSKKVSESTTRNIISMAAILLGLCLIFVGSSLKELTQTIVINIASNLITTGFFALLVLDRIFLAQEKQDRKILNETFKKNQEKIKIILVEKESKVLYELPLEMLRGEFNRGEVLARIGMLPTTEKGIRFSIDYTGSPEFLTEINNISADVTCKELKIPCTKKEIEQFKMFGSPKVDRIPEKIEIILIEKVSGARYELPLEMLRKDFNRGEILARIGMLPTTTKGVGVSIEYVRGQKFLREINDVSTEVTRKVLEIPCTREEIEQFKMFTPSKLDKIAEPIVEEKDYNQD